MGDLLDTVRWAAGHFADDPGELWTVIVYDHLENLSAPAPDDLDEALAAAQDIMQGWPDERRAMEVGDAFPELPGFHPALPLVRHLSLIEELGEEDMALLAADPGAGSLTRLTVDCFTLTDPMVDALLSVAGTPAVILGAHVQEISEGGMKALLKSPLRERLTLDLSFRPDTLAGEVWARLSEIPGLPPPLRDALRWRAG